jgi:hypothetical protein
MNVLSPAAVIVDGNGNTVAAAPATALAAAQSAVLCCGSDYGATAKGQALKADALGQQYVVPASTTGVNMPLGINATGSSTGGFGFAALGYDATTSPGYWRPQAVNANGNPISAVAYMPTIVGICQNVATGTASGKSMMSCFNASSTTYLRLCAQYLVCPPQLTVSGLLTAVQQTYNQILVGGFRFTNAHTGGTAGTVAGYDTADTVDSNITFRSGATITGEAAAPHIIADAAYNPSYPLMYREDAASKEIVIPPGQGYHFRLVAAPTGSVTFQCRMILTQALS